MIVNRDPNARGPYTAFAEVAGAYERGRPGYPEEAVRWLAGDERCDVVDLGAGTGKLTCALVELGHRVTAIEPLPEMLERLPAAAPGAFAILGSAEVIPLPDTHADVVTCPFPTVLLSTCRRVRETSACVNRGASRGSTR